MVLKVSNRKAVVLGYVLISTLILWMLSWETLSFCIVAFILAGVCIWACRFNVLHPSFCFFPFFTLYTCAYPFLKMMGYDTLVRGVGIPIEPVTVQLSWIGLSIMSILLITLKDDGTVDYNKDSDELSGTIALWGFYISLVLTVFLYVYAIVRGYSSKRAMIASGDIILTIGKIGMTVNPLFSFLCVLKRKTKKYFLYYYLLAAINGFLAIGFLGERNILLVVMFFMLFSMKYLFDVRTNKLVWFGVIALLVLATSSSLKMFISNDGISGGSGEPLWVRLFSSDFRSAGFNLNNLVRTESGWQYKFGSSLIYDFLSPLDFAIPGLSNFSASRWNQNFFWADSRTGLGFTIIGEGFVNFGYIGVAVWMVLFAGIIRILWNRSKRDPFFFMTYGYGMALCVYASRGVLANVISPVVKYCLLIYIMNKAFKKRKGLNQHE